VAVGWQSDSRLVAVGWQSDMTVWPHHPWPSRPPSRYWGLGGSGSEIGLIMGIEPPSVGFHSLHRLPCSILNQLPASPPPNQPSVTIGTPTPLPTLLAARAMASSILGLPWAAVRSKSGNPRCRDLGACTRFPPPMSSRACSNASCWRPRAPWYPGGGWEALRGRYQVRGGTTEMPSVSGYTAHI
jgi:hypothetical protein